MSLTSHLRSPQSPVYRFLYQQFPNIHQIIGECRAQLGTAQTIRPRAPVPWGTLGMALDYRLRYYFAVTPAEQLVAWEGALRASADGKPLRDGVRVIFAAGEATLLPSGLTDAFFASLTKEVLCTLSWMAV